MSVSSIAESCWFREKTDVVGHQDAGVNLKADDMVNGFGEMDARFPTNDVLI